ncbi:hypothetical protein D3C78_408770 [compost metagenome]
MHIAKAYGADGGGAAEHGCGHGAHVQGRAQVAPCHQVVFVGFCAPHAIPAQPEHAGGIDHYNNDVQGHWGSPDYLYYGEIDRSGGFTAPGGLVLCWRASVALPHGSCRGAASFSGARRRAARRAFRTAGWHRAARCCRWCRKAGRLRQGHSRSGPGRGSRE